MTDYPREILRLGVTREWVGEGELPKERTQSEMTEALRFRGQGRREERDADARQRIVGLWVSNAMVPQRRDFRGVIDPLLLWRESIGRKRGRGGGECRGELQVPRQDGRTKAKELHKTGVDGLLIKITENEGLQVDVGVLDQGTK
ncbi:hypothetical protein B296_00008482 [Ensete ventricosum]|uniref:Uncharacterized protein n=1 Tax=Ensete ventricosum TaxID=4639 RepID=A0A426YH46_ENSVE|nr:hypothetical protein B296_00008482 [Ensete ventricosum]